MINFNILNLYFINKLGIFEKIKLKKKKKGVT